MRDHISETLRASTKSRTWAIAASVALATTMTANAATYTWDSSGSTPATPVDGAGAWNLSSPNFVTAGANAVWVNVSSGTGHEAVFGANNGAAGTVTLGTDMTVGALTFNAASSGNYTLTGGSLKALAGNITVRVNANATIDSPIVGAASSWGSFDVSGPGTLTLTGNSTFVGPILVVNAGATVSVPVLNRGNVAGPLGQSSGGVRLAGGTLAYTGSGTASSNNTIRFGTTGGTLDMQGAGVMNFSALGNIGSSLAASRTINLTGSSTAANNLSGYGLLQAAVAEYATRTNGAVTHLRKTGSGAWYLSAATTIAGDTTIEQGRLGIMANNVLPATTTVTLGKAGTSNAAMLDLGPVVNVSGIAGVTSYNLTVAGLAAAGNDLTKTIITNNDTSSAAASHVATLTVNPSGATVPADSTYGGLIVDGATSKVALVKAGSQVLTLTGDNGYSGGTTLSGGTLRTTETGNLGNGNVTVSASGAVLEIGNSASINDGSSLTLAAGSVLKMAFASTSDPATFEKVTSLNLGGTVFNTYITFSAGNYHGFDAYFTGSSSTATLQVVPEPAALLSTVGLGGLALLSRRRKAC